MTKNAQQEKTHNLFHKLFYLDKEESLKVLVGGLLFFFIIGAYTLCQEMKYGVFSLIVGTHHVPAAKVLAFAALLPAIILDGYLVDRMKRYRLLILYCCIFSLLGILFTILFMHPQIGLDNTTKDPYRLMGWAFFIYVEAFSPFLLGVFWAFMNSIHNPENAQKTYGLIVSFSKVSGIIVAFAAANFFINHSFLNIELETTQKIRYILLFSSCLLLCASLFLFLMIKKLNLRAFKGYHTDIIEEKTQKTGVFLGLSLLVKNRYVLGVFLLVFLGDILGEILNYKRLLLVVEGGKSAKGHDLSHVLSSLYSQLCYMHLIGLGLSIFFTNSIMRFFSTRLCIFIMPIFTLISGLVYIVTGLDQIVIWLYIVNKAMYYTIGTPVRESLYIITSKDIQFKAKFAIDAVGSKLSRNAGQTFNVITNVLGKNYGAACGVMFTNILLIVIPLFWIMTAFVVGKKYQKTLKNNEIIS